MYSVRPVRLAGVHVCHALATNRSVVIKLTGSLPIQPLPLYHTNYHLNLLAARILVF
jgi:hypothetical protein